MYNELRYFVDICYLLYDFRTFMYLNVQSDYIFVLSFVFLF